jgi:cell wall-associated NlpC family hydrolase
VINRKSSTTRSGRPVRRTRFLLLTTVAVALVGPVSHFSAAKAQVPVQAGKYSDPLADVASTALNALMNGARSSVGATGSLKAVPGKSVQAGVPVNSIPPTLTVSTIVGPSATAVVTAAGAAAQPTATIQAATAPVAGSSWSSILIATDDLSTYTNGGIAIEVAVAPETAATLAALPADPGDRYVASLKTLAAYVEGRSKANADALLKVWLNTDEQRMRVILVALSQVGTVYRYTGNQPGGFDCSGLTSYAWGRAGVKIPRVSADQINAAVPRNLSTMLPGDLWYRPGHIGLYLGVGDAMVHAPQTGKTVEVKGMGRTTRFGSPI